MRKGSRKRYVTFLILVVLLTSLTSPKLVRADEVTGSGDYKSYYFDEAAGIGYLNLTDGQTWTLTLTDINVSQITENKIFQFFIQDYGAGSGYEMLTIQVHADYYGPGGHLLQNYDKGWVLKSSQTFMPGTVLGKFDLRMQIKDLGSNYQVTPQYRLPEGNWQTFQGGAWLSATYRLTQAYIMTQIEPGSDGTVIYNAPTAHSESVWHVDKNGQIQSAIEEAGSDKMVVIYGGTHLESLYINKSLTIRGVKNPIVRGSGQHTVDYRETQLTRETVIFITNSSYVLLQNLDIQGDGLGPGNSDGVFLVYSEVEMENCTVSPNTVGDADALGIEARASKLRVDESIIENFGKTGIYFGNSSGTVCNSTIKGSVYTAPNSASYGIEIDVYRQGPSTLTIVGNQILDCDNTYSPEPSTPSIAIAIDLWRRYDDLAASSVVIENNFIHNNYEAFEVVANNSIYALYNDISSNRHGVIVDSDYSSRNATFDARFNWWGTPTRPLTRPMQAELETP